MGAKFCFVCQGIGKINHDSLCELGCGRVAVKTVENKKICFSVTCFEAAKRGVIQPQQNSWEDGESYSLWLQGSGHLL